jgi:hypothetical protein
MGWAWCLPYIIMYHMYFLVQKAVGFETSCVYFAVYVFLRRRNVRFYLRVMYMLLHCPEIPWWCFSDLPGKCIEIYLKNNLFILIRYFDACFVLFLRHKMTHSLSYMSRYVRRDLSCCIHRETTCRTEHFY